MTETVSLCKLPKKTSSLNISLVLYFGHPYFLFVRTLSDKPIPENNGKTITEFISGHKEFIGRGLDYSVVAVLGAQSSGKSTLLNILFGMKFQVLHADIGRQRTTQGVWLGVPPLAPRDEVGSLLVMDVEGTDGDSRQDELSFERKTSLFSLAVCSVLIVNIWYQDVGRYAASNMALLRTVFDINLQLFANSK